VHKFRTVLIGLFALMFITPVFAADQVVDGQFGPGALYRLVRPADWNGSLVLYAHGAVSVDQPVVLPDEANLLVSLLTPQGVAVAFTSFSENGWAVKDGAQRTEQLLGIFKSKFGAPSRVYIAGGSMGGLIAIKLAETHPENYDGVLPACANAGGSQRQFDYLSHVRVLFDFFYPGLPGHPVLPGDAGFVDPAIDPNQAIVLPATAAMLSDPAGAFAIAAIDQTPVPFASPEELVQSIVTALVLHASLFTDLPDRLHGHSFFDNRQTTYTGTLTLALLQAINIGAERFDADPSALEYLQHYYNPSGNLHIPTLMLSDSLDPEAPAFNQTAYTSAVALNGHPDLLVSRLVARYGHCAFTPAELGKAFGDLVLWVESGLKPMP